MLISFEKKFIFIANTKTASNSIEKILQPYSQIIISSPPLGKHDTLKLVLQKYSFLFYDKWSTEKLDDYLIFGVMREPISWLISWFNYNSRPSLKGDAQYTGDMTLIEFLTRIKTKGFQNLSGVQRHKFLNNRDKVGVDRILLYEELHETFPILLKELKIESNLELSSTRKNVTSSIRRKAQDLSTGEIELATQILQQEIEFYNWVKSSKFHLANS